MKKRKNVKALHNFHIAFGIMIKIYPEKFIMELLLTIFNNIISFFSFTYILRFVVNGLQTERPVSQLIAYVMIMMVLQVLISSVSIVCNNYFAPIFNKRSESRMNAIINKKSLESDIANYEDPQMYALYGRALSGGVGSIEKVGTTITSITGMVINLALSSFLIVAIDPVLFVFALMPLLINITNKYVSRKRYEYGVISSEIMRKNGYTQRVFYQSEYAKEMRLTNIHRVMLRDFRESVDAFVHLAKTKGVRLALMFFFSNLVSAKLPVAGAEIYTIYRALVSKTVLIGDCLVVFSAITTVSRIFKRVEREVSAIFDIGYSFQDYRDFMSREEKIETCKSGAAASGGDIELRDVSFRYGGASDDSLHDIDLKLRQGEKLAIVGLNGAGKTTLVKLLLRLYDPTGGTVLMDGRDIREYNIDSYRACFGIVFQDYKQLAVSVGENVLGRPMRDGDEALVESSLKKAGLWNKISQLPDGIHTVMTREFDENGLILSGGESQKLAIASVYARDSSVVILDEPSSALDPIAEKQMYDQMYEACRDKTMIFISHRLSSATDADRIILMENGTIKETGTHAELMRLGGSYAEMFRAQAESYAR